MTWLQLLTLTLLLLAGAPPASAIPTDGSTTRVLFGGDLRGVLGGPRGKVARAHGLVADRRRAEPDLLLLSTGSVLGPSPLSAVDGGAAVVRVMNEVGYQAMALGRKDFFAGKENTLRQLSRARFPVVASNLALKSKDPELAARWSKLRPWVRLEQAGRSVVVLGVISPQATSYGPEWDPELEVLPLVETLRKHKEEAGEADAYLLLGTMSFREAATVLRDLPWLDLVLANKIGGDEFLDDTSFEYRLRDGRGVVWTETLQRSMGEVTIAEHADGTRYDAVSHPVRPDQEPDEQARETVTAARAEAATVLDEVVGELTDEELADFPSAIADGLRHELRCEVAVLHKGSVRMDVPPPRTLTRRALRLTYPFTDHGTRILMKGSDLRALWAGRNRNYDPDRNLLFAGMEERGGVVLVNGRALRNGDMYRVATVDFLTLGGFGDILTGIGTVGRVRSVDLLESWFRRDGRAQHVARLERRMVYRHRTLVDASYAETRFTGSAMQRQYQEPATINRSSEIPGLVGLPFHSFDLGLDHESVLDHPGHDLLLRLKGNFKIFAPNSFELNAVDKATVAVRIEQKKPTRRRKPTLYGQLDLSTAFDSVDEPGRENPLFMKAVGGYLWRRNDQFRVFAGLGTIFQFSLPGNPQANGLHLGYEFERKLSRELHLRSLLDGFVSLDSDDLRTADWTNELRIGLGRGVHTVLKHTLFLYEDGTIKDVAKRGETFIGLGYDISGRKR